MRILLDTQVLLAVIKSETGSLGSPIRRALDAPNIEASISVASLWETAIKWRLGKLELPARPERLPELIGAVGFELLPINADHAVAWAEPDPPTRDPFDRLLLAVCKVEGLQLLTTDRALASHPLAAQLT